MYKGGRKHEALLEFINSKTGLHRTPGGDLDGSAGLVASLDSLVAQLTGGESLADMASAAKEHVSAIMDEAQLKAAQYYIKVFDKLAQSEGYAAKEFGRLKGILGKGGLAPKKRDEIQTKLNVLQQFIQKVAYKAEAIKEDIRDEL